MKRTVTIVARNTNMRISHKNILLTLVLSFMPVFLAAQQQSVVAGYYAYWLRDAVPASSLKYDYLTHVNHAFAWPDSNGTIVTPDGVPDGDLVYATHQAGKKILIALGGGSESGGFPRMTADSLRRDVFIQNLLEFLAINGYDGVDIDWEYPQNNIEKNNLTALVKEIRAAFVDYDSTLLITMAIPASNWSGQRYDLTALTPYVNWFNVMTYDFHGNWTSDAGHNAPLYAPPTDPDGSVDQGFTYVAVTRGVPTSKITIGIPFYGQNFTAPGLYQHQTGCSSVIYSTIAPLVGQSGWTRIWDDVSKVPYLQNGGHTAIISYDDSMSIDMKCAYAKSKNTAGVMIWALGEDMVGQNQPLMDAVGIAMTTVNAISTGTTDDIRNFKLIGNYPNPFNPATRIKFQVGSSRFVTLRVYDILGHGVATLINEQLRPGVYEADFSGEQLPSGVYFYRLTAGNYSNSKKMLLLK